MARAWNLDGLYRHAQGVRERGAGIRRGRAKVEKNEPMLCDKCRRLIFHYKGTHMEICEGKR